MKKYNNITEIPARHYEGYIWEADDKNPEMIDKFFDFSSHEPKPYIIEALLYSKKDNVSIHIRHSGREHINEYDLGNLPSEAELHEVKYLPHRLLGSVKKVHFQQLWMPEKDPLCDNMEVLKMKALIFTGFDNNKKS